MDDGERIGLGAAVALVMLVVCTLLAWKVQRSRRQREAVAWVLRQQDGEVIYAHELDDRSRLIPDAKPPGPAWLIDTLGVDFFAKVTRVRVETG